MAARFKYPIKRSPKSDPQQYLVYRMENEAIGARAYMSMGRGAMRTLARSVCKNYRVPQVRLSWTSKLGSWAAEWREQPSKQTSLILLNTAKGTSQDLLTITHELAHHIHHWLSAGADDKQEPHGPEFMACHMSILDTIRAIPVGGMKAVCDSYKVRYHDPGPSQSLSKLAQICNRKPKR